jgi:hypothetical protein
VTVRTRRLPFHRISTGGHRAEYLRGQRLGVFGRKPQGIKRNRLSSGIEQRESTQRNRQGLVERQSQRAWHGLHVARGGWL